MPSHLGAYIPGHVGTAKELVQCWKDADAKICKDSEAKTFL